MSDAPNSHEIRNLMDALDTASALMGSKARPEDIVIFIGTTKAGKSTLINYMLGSELQGVAEQPWLPVSITKTSNYGPAIGGGSCSETIVPTRWDKATRLPGLVLWDAPGFEDNRGPTQDITNAYYIFQLFKKIRSIKIVLVVDVTDITNDRINPFLALLQSVKNLLRERMRDCFSSIVVAFTKVPDNLNNFPANVDLMCEWLDYKILRNQSLYMSPEGRDLVAHLVRHPQQIGLFKMAGEGLIGPEIEQGVSSAILGIQSVSSDVLREVVCPSLADKSQNFLFRSRENLSSMAAFKELVDIAMTVFQEKVDNVQKSGGADKTQLEAKKVQLSVDLNDIGEVLKPGTSFQRKINLLERSDQRIEDKVRAHSLIQRAELMQFVDKLLDLKESREFDIYVEAVLCNAKAEIQKAISEIELKLGLITAEQHASKVQKANTDYEGEIKEIKEDLKKVKKHNKKKKEEYGTFAGVGKKIDDVVTDCGNLVAKTWGKVTSWF